jgi:hypothetical protein
MRPITQALDAVIVETMHPIPETLLIHPRKAGRVLATRALEHRRQSQHPPRSTAVGLDVRAATHLGSWDVGADRHGSGHGAYPFLPNSQPGRSYFTNRTSRIIAVLVLHHAEGHDPWGLAHRPWLADVEPDDDLLASVPGVSHAISKSLLAELPLLATFDRRSMAALAKLARFTRQSGPLMTNGGAARPSSPRA